MAGELSERQKAALIRQQLSDANARGEAARAKVLIDEFLAAAKERGLQPRPLKARTLDGHTVKTDKTGWYLRTNHSVALDTEGNYYSLVVPGGWKERLRGVKLQPTLAPLVIGRGGRDGETGDLREFLAWTLDGTIPQDRAAPGALALLVAAHRPSAADRAPRPDVGASTRGGSLRIPGIQL